MTNSPQRHIISLLVENKFGVLAKVAGLFSIRGYNIDSFAVGPTDDPALSRMTVVVHGDEQTVEQITKQLNKLIDTVTVRHLCKHKHVEVELCLLRVHASRERRSEVTHLAEIAGAKVLDVQAAALLLQLVDTEEKVSQFIELMKPFGIQDIARSGTVALRKPEKQ
jgi:acetolactate synthase-1/3 small subunit